MSRLPSGSVYELYDAAIACGLSRESLVSGFSAHYLAQLRERSRPGARILSDLHAMNDTEPLLDGTDPLRTWLRNAHALSKPRRECLVFLKYLRWVDRPDTSTAPRRSLEVAKTATSLAQFSLRSQAHSPEDRRARSPTLTVVGVLLISFVLLLFFGPPSVGPRGYGKSSTQASVERALASSHALDWKPPPKQQVEVEREDDVQQKLMGACASDDECAKNLRSHLMAGLEGVNPDSVPYWNPMPLKDPVTGVIRNYPHLRAAQAACGTGKRLPTIDEFHQALRYGTLDFTRWPNVTFWTSTGLPVQVQGGRVQALPETNGAAVLCIKE